MFGRFLKRDDPSREYPLEPERVLAAAEPVAGHLFRVVGPEDGASVCNDWVGAVLSIDGSNVEFPSFSQAVADGLFHPGCRHSLRAYSGEHDGGQDEAQAVFRSQLARELMQARVADGEPGAEERFARLYAWARRADRAGATTIAAILCEAALELLNDRDLFGESGDELGRLLRARISTIRSTSADQ